MINEIKKAIATKLYTNFPNNKIYTESIEQGFDRPCFFIEINPLSTTNLNKYYRDKFINIHIHYFSENYTNEENFSMISNLEEVFDMVLSVGDRNHTLGEKTTNIVDKVLHFSFDLSFIDSIEGIEITKGDVTISMPKVDINQHLGYTIDDIELMQELNMKEEL